MMREIRYLKRNLRLFVIEDNGGGKRNDDVPIGLMLDESLGLLREFLGDMGGFRRVA